MENIEKLKAKYTTQDKKQKQRLSKINQYKAEKRKADDKNSSGIIHTCIQSSIAFDNICKELNKLALRSKVADAVKLIKKNDPLILLSITTTYAYSDLIELRKLTVSTISEFERMVKLCCNLGLTYDQLFGLVCEGIIQ